MKKTTLHLLAFTGVVLLASCGSNNTDNSKAALSDSTKTETSTQAPASSSSNTSITVALTGGSMDGTYTAGCDGCCSYGIAGDHTFGTQYSETGKADKELSSVQLIVKNVNTGHTSTKSFTLTVGFGDLISSNGKSFNIMTDGKSKGSGTVDIDYSGNKATVVIKGTSAEGAAIDLKMECGKITTMDNIGK